MKRTKCIIRNPKDERIKKWCKKIGDETAWIIPTVNLIPGNKNIQVIQRNQN